MDRRAQAALEIFVALVLVWFVTCILGERYGWKGPEWTPQSTALWPLYVGRDTPEVWDRLAAPLGAFVLAWIALRGWLRAPEGDVGRLVGLCAAAFLFHLACGLVRGGVVEGLEHTFKRGNEYWFDIGFVHHGFLRKFPEVGGRLSQHGETHPPGIILILAALNWLGFSTRQDAALVCSTAASLTALPLWGAARRLAGDEVARFCVALFLFACSVTAFAVLAMDSLTMLIVTTALYGFARALDGERWGGVIWGVALAAASLCHFLALASALTCGVLVLARVRELDRRRWLALALGPAAFFAVYAVLVFHFGYRPLHVFASNLKSFDASVDVKRDRLHSLVGVPMGFLFMLGLPLGAVVARSLGGAFLRLRRDRRDALLVLAASLPWLAAVAAGKPRGEAERIYLMFVPPVVLAAALAARRWYARSARWLLYLALPLLALQSILVEVYLETYW